MSKIFKITIDKNNVFEVEDRVLIKEDAKDNVEYIDIVSDYAEMITDGKYTYLEYELIENNLKNEIEEF